MRDNSTSKFHILPVGNIPHFSPADSQLSPRAQVRVQRPAMCDSAAPGLGNLSRGPVRLR